MADIDFNKAKVEKAAKAKERKLLDTLDIDQKSVVRAIARYDASKELYPTATKDQLLSALVDAFYKNAKYQPSWDAPFKKHAADLGEKLKSMLGTPAPRGRRAKTVAAPPPDHEDPEATLGRYPEGG